MRTEDADVRTSGMPFIAGNEQRVQNEPVSPAAAARGPVRAADRHRRRRPFLFRPI